MTPKIAIPANIIIAVYNICLNFATIRSDNHKFNFFETAKQYCLFLPSKFHDNLLKKPDD